MYKVQKYSAEDKTQWDAFVDGSKNGTFMLKRDYVEYHSDRFADFSLMVFDEKSLVSVLPASIHDSEVRSHGGLTYGGFVVDVRMTVQKMLLVFESVMDYLRERGITILVYKRVPSIYYRYPADEDLYALFRFNAELFRRDVSTTILLSRKLSFSERRRRNVKKAIKSGLVFSESSDYVEYIKMLTQVLSARHGVAPVHTAQELEKLSSNFPDNIKLYVALKDGKMLAGTVLFVTNDVAHAQYIANSEEGRNCGALDFVFDRLINSMYADRSYFDFGISTENTGRFLNEGLVEQKQEFGGRAIVYDFYRINLK